jgi:alpha-tubulin suppressor-like RCC1 family protein
MFEDLMFHPSDKFFVNLSSKMEQQEQRQRLFVSLEPKCCFNQVNQNHFKSPITLISAGESCAFISTANNEIYMYGTCEGINHKPTIEYNDDSNLLLSRIDSLLPANYEIRLMAAGGHFLLVSNGVSVLGIGSNSDYQLALNHSSSMSIFGKAIFDPALSDRITQLAAGHYHSVALVDDRFIYSAGYNGVCQLGFHDTNNRKVFSLITNPLLNNVPIQEISCGGAHTVVLTKHNKLYTFGWYDII